MNTENEKPQAALFTALAEAQNEISNPALDSINPHFKAKYASLAALRNSVVPVLARRGIAVIQQVEYESGKVVCITTLAHKEGGTIRSQLSLPVPQPTPQAIGSAITYARRYSLAALVCVAGEEDDDAEGAKDKSPVDKAKALRIQKIMSAIPRANTTEQIETLRDMARKACAEKDLLDAINERAEVIEFSEDPVEEEEATQ